jgi:mannose-6-phosphate isomerase-like protein (cupin superfamily)
MTEPAAPRPRFAIYRAGQAPLLQDTDMMYSAAADTSATGEPGGEALDFGDRPYGAKVSVLYRSDADDGLSLAHVWLKQNFIISRHRHNADCLYYVISGEAILGSQVLRPGDGFFVPADHPYAYRAGSEGVEVLEFRGVSSFDYTSLESPERWAQLLASASANRADWERDTVPPSWVSSQVAAGADGASQSD